MDGLLKISGRLLSDEGCGRLGVTSSDRNWEPAEFEGGQKVQSIYIHNHVPWELILILIYGNYIGDAIPGGFDVTC